MPKITSHRHDLSSPYPAIDGSFPSTLDICTTDRHDEAEWVDECKEIAITLINKLSRCGRTELANRLNRCWSSWQVEAKRGYARIISARRCRLRNIYPACHHAWASGHARKYSCRFVLLADEGYKLHFLTLTVASVIELTRRFICAIWQCWSNQRRQKLFGKCVATLACLDVHKSRRGWQVHLHIVVASASMPRLSAIKIAWYRLTAEISAGYVVDVRRIEVAQIRTVILYSLKRVEGLSIEDRLAWVDATRGMDLLRASGRVRSGKRATL